MYTFIPENGVDRVSGNGAGDDHCLSGYDGDFIHWADEWKSIDIETGRMVRISHFAGCRALVKTSVIGVDSGDVEVGDHFVRSSRKVTNLYPKQSVACQHDSNPELRNKALRHTFPTTQSFCHPAPR